MKRIITIIVLTAICFFFIFGKNIPVKIVSENIQRNDTIPYNKNLSSYGYIISRIIVDSGLVIPNGDTTFGTDNVRVGAMVYRTVGGDSTLYIRLPSRWVRIGTAGLIQILSKNAAGDSIFLSGGGGSVLDRDTQQLSLITGAINGDTLKLTASTPVILPYLARSALIDSLNNNRQILGYNATTNRLWLYPPSGDTVNLNAASVFSVNGKTGAVTLTTDSINEGSNNLYFTKARAQAAISSVQPISYNNSNGIIGLNISDSAGNSLKINPDGLFSNGITSAVLHSVTSAKGIILYGNGQTVNDSLRIAPDTNVLATPNYVNTQINNLGAKTVSVIAGNSAVSVTGGTQPLSSNPTFSISANNTLPLWNAVQLQGLPILNSAPSAGQVLFFNGTSWTPYSLNPGSGTVTSVGLNAGYGTTISSNTTNPITSSGTFTTSVDTNKIANLRYADSALATKKNMSDSTLITGYSTIGGMNDTLNKINGINGWLYNPATKTGQVDSTKYSTVRATHDSIVANIPNLSIYTKYTDTSNMLLPYTKKGSNVSQFYNDIGYLTSIPNLPLPTSYLSANGDTVVSASDTGWDQRLRENGNIVQYKGKYWAFYNGYKVPYTDSTAYCGIAYSNDGVHWTKGGPYGTGRITWYPSEDPYCIIVNDTAYLYTENKGVPAGKHNIILFKSTDMVNFIYSGVAFDLPSDTSAWDSYDVSSPLVTFDTSSHKYYLFYEGIKHTSGITGNASIGVAYSTNPDTFYRFLSTPVIVPGVTLKWANTQAVPDDIIHQNGTWYLIGHTQYGNPLISDPYVPFVCSSVDLVHWQDYLGGTIQRNSDQFSDFGDGVMIFNHADSRSAMYMSNDGDTALILGNFTNPGFRNDNISMLDYQMTGNVGFYNNGYLIITNIDTSEVGNWVLKMEGNSYNSLTPLNAEIQFSNKSGVNGFSRIGATSTMYNINANLFYYEGKICFWTDGGVLSNQFQYLRFSISGSGIITRIDSVLNQTLPGNILSNTPLSFYNNYYNFRIGSDNNSYYTQFNQADGGTGDLFDINSLNQSIFGFNYSNGTFISYIPYINGYYGLALNTGSTSFNQANIRLFINNVGKVGIGTLNPSYLLDVLGNARINLTPSGIAGTDSVLVKSSSTGEISAISPSYYISANQNNYIQNQFSSPQTSSSYWIDGNGRIDGNMGIGGDSLAMWNKTYDIGSLGAGGFLRNSTHTSLTNSSSSTFLGDLMNLNGNLEFDNPNSLYLETVGAEGSIASGVMGFLSLNSSGTSTWIYTSSSSALTGLMGVVRLFNNANYGVISSVTALPAYTFTQGSFTSFTGHIDTLSQLFLPASIAGANVENKVGNNYGILQLTNYPNSYNGGTQEPIVTSSVGYTITTADYTVINTAGTNDFTMPAANTCKGQIFHLICNTGTVTLSIGYLNYSGTNTTSIAAGSGVTIQSNGTSYYQIGQ